MSIPPMSPVIAPLPKAAAASQAVPQPPTAAAPVPITALTADGAQKLVGSTVAADGVVTAVLSKGGSRPTHGVFVQEPKRAAGATSSSGIFVRLAEPASVGVGDAVRAVGLLASGDGGVREITGEVSKTGTATLPKPVRLKLPQDAASAYEVLKAHRGMMVEVPRGLVLTPASPYGTYSVRAHPDKPGATHLKRDFDLDRDGTKLVVSAEYAKNRPIVGTGDVVEGIVGPLGYEFGEHRVMHTADTKVTAGAGPAKSFRGDLDADGAISATDLAALKARVGTLATGPTDIADLDGNGKISATDVKLATQRASRVTGAPTVRLASLNVENLFDTVDDPKTRDTVLRPDQYERKLNSLAGLIKNTLQNAGIIGIQEAENDVVLRDLAAHPTIKDAGYEVAWMEGIDPRSIDVALMYRPSAGVSVSNLRQLQGQDADQQPIFQRPPLVADVDIARDGGKGDPLQLTVLVNHFKSKASPDGSPTEPARIQQAEFIRDAAAELASANPKREVVVLGDLNDFDSSKALQILASPAKDGAKALKNVGWEMIPKGERYSYTFRGQANNIDHVLMAPSLLKRVEFAQVHHVHSDLPADRSKPERPTDHDPISVDIRTN